MKKTFLTLAIAVLILAGCGSLHKKADKAYVSGEYRSAAALYTEILKRTPNDPVALERIQSRASEIDPGSID